MNNGETPPPKPGLSLAPEQTNADDAPAATPFRSRTDELLANSSLSLMPVEDAPEVVEDASAPAEEAVEQAQPETTDVGTDVTVEAELEPAPLMPEPVLEPTPEIATLEASAETVDFASENLVLGSDDEPSVVESAASVELALEPVAERQITEPEAIEPDAIKEAATALDTIELSQEEALTPPSEPDMAKMATDPEALSTVETTAETPAEAEPDTAAEPTAENEPNTTAASPISLSLEPAEVEARETVAVATEPVSAPAELSLEPLDATAPTHEPPAPVAVDAAESTAAETPLESPAEVSTAAVENVADQAVTDTAPLALEPSADTPPPRTGKAVFEARPVQGQAEHVLEIPPPPVKKPVEPEAPAAAESAEEAAPVRRVETAPAPSVETTSVVRPKAAPAPTPAPVPEPAPVEEPKRAKSGGLFAKVGEWKGHLNYLHNLYKEDPTTAVSHWKQTFKERGALAEALQQLQERQHADNFAWEEIPRTLDQFHLRDEDRGQADWYGDAARQYQVVLNAIEKQKTFKPALIQPLLKELKFIAEADAFHQKYGLTAIQQKVKTMYQTLQHRIDEYMKLQKQQLELAVKDKEIEKLRAQEAIATAEAQKVAQENRLVQEQRLKVVEDKKRLEAKRAAEEAERVRLERQREIEAEQAEVRRREELSASFRAIEQEELMRKALQNMSLSQCAEGLLRQLFEKDQLNEQEKAAAARVLDVLKAKLN